MTNNDQDIGYMKGQVDAMRRRLDDHVRLEESYHEKIERETRARFDDIEGKLDLIHETVQQAHAFARFTRLLGYSLLAALAFKFGDITRIWRDW